MARWVNIVETNCIDASREKEFLDWYENIHVPDALETPGYLSGRIYVAKEFRDGRGQFLGIYEIETDDIDETMTLRLERRKREREQGRYRDLFTVVWRDVLWKLMFERVMRNKESHKGERWVNIVETNCIDASREKEFLDWYENIHVPDALETPGYLSGRIYVAKEFRDGRGQFLGIYEIETDDIDETMTLRLERRKREREQGRYRDLFTAVWRDVLWRLMFQRTVDKA